MSDCGDNLIDDVTNIVGNYLRRQHLLDLKVRATVLKNELKDFFQLFRVHFILGKDY